VIVVSLGAGVQSSAMLLMALDGVFGVVPDAAIFADTGFEPKDVYDWLDKLEQMVKPFPIHRVENGNLRADAESGSANGHRMAAIPFFMDDGRVMGRRQCTNEYKLVPIKRWVRANCKQAEMLIGISTDEAHRMKPSRVKYITNRYPLIENRLSRVDCVKYLVERVGTEPPKSACIGCPYHGDAFWLKLKRESPEEFQAACEFDEAIRTSGRMKLPQFVHRSCRPLSKVVFKHEGQSDLDLHFGNECEGLCGL